MADTYTAAEIRQAGNDINWPNHASNLVDHLESALPGGPWNADAIRRAAGKLGALSLVDALLARVRINRKSAQDAQDEIMFKGSELIAAVPRVVQAFTLKDHIHPAMLDVDGLGSQLIRDMINHRETWDHGDVVEDANGSVWKLVSGKRWIAFGSSLRHGWGVPKRPLKLLKRDT